MVVFKVKLFCWWLQTLCALGRSASERRSVFFLYFPPVIITPETFVQCHDKDADSLLLDFSPVSLSLECVYSVMQCYRMCIFVYLLPWSKIRTISSPLWSLRLPVSVHRWGFRDLGDDQSENHNQETHDHRGLTLTGCMLGKSLISRSYLGIWARGCLLKREGEQGNQRKSGIAKGLCV